MQYEQGSHPTHPGEVPRVCWFFPEGTTGTKGQVIGDTSGITVYFWIRSFVCMKTIVVYKTIHTCQFLTIIQFIIQLLMVYVHVQMRCVVSHCLLISTCIVCPQRGMGFPAVYRQSVHTQHGIALSWTFTSHTCIKIAPYARNMPLKQCVVCAWYSASQLPSTLHI